MDKYANGLILHINCLNILVWFCCTSIATSSKLSLVFVLIFIISSSKNYNNSIISDVGTIL